MKIKNIKNIEFFTKGKRGHIHTGFIGKTKVAIKSKNPESKAVGRIENEAKMLQQLNKHSIGPKLLKHTKEYIVCRFVKGMFIKNFLESDFSTKKQIKKVLENVFKQCFKMDRLGLQKQEMTNPYKHIVISFSEKNKKNNKKSDNKNEQDKKKNTKDITSQKNENIKNKPITKITLLDFERCSKKEKPANVTQFCQYVMRNKGLLEKKGFKINKEKLIKLAKAYKDMFNNRKQTADNLKKIMNSLE